MEMRVTNMLSKNDHTGFTLVELLIAMVVSGIIAGALYSTYLTQQRSYTAQEAVAEMQQNLRAAMVLMSWDIRIAGYDPSGNAGAGVTAASVGQISFTQDLTNDGDTNDAGEAIDYGFSLAADVGRDGIPDADSDGDGVPDAMSLGKQTGGAGGYQPIADNIQAIEFLYLDGNGVVTATPANIRAVRVSILARASRPDQNFTNTRVYTPASTVAWDLNGAAAGNAPNDHFRRRLLITTIQCRNMGL